MKKLYFLLPFLMPCFLLAQDDPPDLVFEIVRLTPNGEMMGEFESAMASHNKQFHGEGVHGARVYSITSGFDAGKYVG